MRQSLRDAGKHVPRSNKDTEIAYTELKNINTGEGYEEPKGEIEKVIPTEDSVVKLVSSNVYTYIGAGDEPPHMINYMGIQKFVRGQAIEVSPNVAEKIRNHRCFVKGEVDQESMFKNDELEKAKVSLQRKEDELTDAKTKLLNRA